MVGTYRSMRQPRYDLDNWRHSGSLVPRWDRIHLRYDSIIDLHSPGMPYQLLNGAKLAFWGNARALHRVVRMTSREEEDEPS
jgi:hypothetical protein